MMTLVAVPLNAKTKYPVEVYQAVLIFSLFTSNRHLRILHNRLRAEEPDLFAQTSAPAAITKLGFRKVNSRQSLPSGGVILAKKNGVFWVMPARTGAAAIKRFIANLVGHPRFKDIFDGYIRELKFTEQLLIRPLQVAFSREELVRNHGFKFVLKRVQEQSKRNAASLQ